MMPLFKAFFVGMGVLFLEKGKNSCEDSFAVSDDGKIDSHIFADRSGIDIDVDDLGLGSKGLDLARDPVIETGPDGNQEIGLHHRHIGPIGSVHP